ncbi:MAG: septum formation protein Maf [Verrucomicrobiales bacterium]|nr:septum formation protein Maf [Verrucomicrobiales bacterium]
MNPTPATTLLTRSLPPVLLASRSPRRVELLRRLLPGFETVPSNATELEDASIGSRRLCELNAQRKALAMSERFPDHLVIGADTLVFLDGVPMAKPADPAEARAMLSRLSGRTHEVVTGVCLVLARASRMRLLSEVTHVRFRALDDAAIGDYLSRVDVLDKAGAYAVQEHGDLIVERVEGSLTNVIGLPIEALRNALERW